MTRKSWLDEETQTPMIDQYARRMGTFMQTLADGIVDADELKAQEQRVVELMQEVEPQLSDELHEKITQLLCELTAYDLMQIFHNLQNARAHTQFRG